MSKKIYIMKDLAGEFKVGISKDPSKRVEQVKYKRDGVKLLYSSDTMQNALGVERAVHLELSDFATGGEWFNCSYKQAMESIHKNAELIGKEVVHSKFKNILIEGPYNKMLTELSAKRKTEKNVVKTKQDIVAELISKQHKKEIK